MKIETSILGLSIGDVFTKEGKRFVVYTIEGGVAYGKPFSTEMELFSCIKIIDPENMLVFVDQLRNMYPFDVIEDSCTVQFANLLDKIEQRCEKIIDRRDSNAKNDL